jgi:acetyl-CoA carboxylase carboxyltransferase component
MHAAKIIKVQEPAMKTGTTLVGLNSTSGARIHEASTPCMVRLAIKL